MTIDFRNQTLELQQIDRKGNKVDPEISEFIPDLKCKVKTRNNVMYIKAEVGQQTLDFCLDTGAESNVICSSCRKDILSTVVINRRTTLSG